MKPTRFTLLLSVLAWLALAVQSASAYYNPTTGRWLNRDPLEEQGGINLHAFVANNPINVFDPLGLDGTAIEEEGAAGIAASMESEGASQAIGILNRVREMADTFNSIQEFTSAVMETAHGDTDDLYISLLSAGASVMTRGAGGRATAEMHHIFPQRADLAKQFKAAGIDINEFKVRLDRSVHKGVRQGGPRGGSWNADWESFLGSGQKSANEIFEFSIELMQKYGINASTLR